MSLFRVNIGAQILNSVWLEDLVTLSLSCAAASEKPINLGTQSLPQSSCASPVWWYVDLCEDPNRQDYYSGSEELRYNPQCQGQDLVQGGYTSRSMPHLHWEAARGRQYSHWLQWHCWSTIHVHFNHVKIPNIPIMIMLSEVSRLEAISIPYMHTW